MMPVPVRMRGWVILEDEKVVTAGGVWFAGNCWMTFVDIPKEARKLKREIVLAGRKIMETIESLQLPVMAYQDPREPTACNILSHYGFEPVDGGYWRR